METLDNGHVITEEDVDAAQLIDRLNRELGIETDPITEHIASVPIELAAPVGRNRSSTDSAFSGASGSKEPALAGDPGRKSRIVFRFTGLEFAAVGVVCALLVFLVFALGVIADSSGSPIGVPGPTVYVTPTPTPTPTRLKTSPITTKVTFDSAELSDVEQPKARTRQINRICQQLGKAVTSKDLTEDRAGLVLVFGGGGTKQGMEDASVVAEQLNSKCVPGEFFRNTVRRSFFDLNLPRGTARMEIYLYER